MAKSKKTKNKPSEKQLSSQKEIAQLKLAVDQQKTAHSLHASILDSLSHPIFAVDSEYKYLVFNQEHIAAMKAIYNVDIALGKSILGYMSVSEDRKSAKANIDRALAGETVIVRQFAGDANLDRRHYEITHAPFADDISGTGVIVLVQDITNLESANLRFKKFFQAVEYSPVSIAVTDLDGALEYVNPKFCELTGYTFEESIGENPRILQSEFTEKETYSQLWETILAGKEWKGEFVNKKKNGELYYESASISPILDEQNNISHFVAIKEDITGRKRIEEKLKKNQASLTALIENTKDDIWSVDSSYCITTLNSNFHRNFLTAFNVSLQIGDNLIEVIEGISPDLKTQWQARYDRALQGEQFVEIDHFNIEGVPNYIEAAFNPIYLNEEIVEVSVFSHDITKRKTAEEALRKANQDLQVHVQQVESLQEKLREQAIRDSLTGLFNFHYIEEVLEREIIRFQRRKKSIGLILLDIDKFKEVNDTYGHNAGNLMLKKLAKVIKENIRGDDIPCRFGGDEFLIVMPETTTQVVFDRAELICKKFAALKIPYKDQEMSATFSAGVIAISPKEYTRDQLLNFVDQALYQAKNEGRNRVITYRGEL